MRRIATLIPILVACFSVSVYGQHSLQFDGGAANYGILSGAGLPPGVTTFTFPTTGGQLITTGSLGSFAWLLGGNTGSAPNNQLGTRDATDLEIITNGVANARMVIDGTTGFIGMGTLPAQTYPLNLHHINTTATPPDYGAGITLDLRPTADITAANKDGLHVNAWLSNSSSDFIQVLDGIRTEVQTYPSYTGDLSYAQGGNFNIFHQAPSTLGQTDGALGSVYLLATGDITFGRGTVGQVLNAGSGTIANAYGFWSRVFSSGPASPITNAFLFYGVNPGSTGLTNLTGLYLEHLTGPAATSTRALWYDHTTRPFVVMSTGEVSIGNENPSLGITLSLYPGSVGSTIQRLHRTGAGQYLATDYQPNGALSATNPRWGTGMMGVGFETGNYSIWSMNGAIDESRLSIDYDGEVGIGMQPVGGTHNSRLTTLSTLTTPLALQTDNARFVHNITPSVLNPHEINNLHIGTNLSSSASNLTGVLDLIRGEFIINPSYTGTLAYAQGGNFSIHHNAPSTLANTDGVLGTVYALNPGVASNITNARGVVGQVQTQTGGTITNAYGFWSRVENYAPGSMTNGYLFYGLNPAAAVNMSNFTGLYLEQFTTPPLATSRALWYDHALRPFVVMANGEVSIGNETPTTGITLSLYPGSVGSTIQRLHRTAAGQYLSTDYQPNGALSATNPRWSTGMMGGAFQTANYSIWTMNGAFDLPRFSIDYDGEVAVGYEPLGGVHNGKFSVVSTLLADPGFSYNNQNLQFNISPTGVVSNQTNNLYYRTNIYSSADNINAVSAGIRGEHAVFNSYTGALGYLQGGNFNIFHEGTGTLAQTDGVIGSVYITGGGVATTTISEARGSVGQVQQFGAGTIDNAYGFWARIAEWNTGTINDGYLFFGANTATTGITNLTGYYLQELTGATNITAFHYDHATSPFIVTGSGELGIGTAAIPAGVKLAVGEGHIQSQQVSVTAAAPGAANNGAGASAGLANATDVAGQLSVTIGANLAAGSQADVTFAIAYTTAPIVVITAADAATAAAMATQQIFITRTVNGFSLNTGVAPALAGDTYRIFYHVIETQ